MIYWSIFFFLAIVALQENGKKTSIKVFNLCFFLLTIMVMLRKGQGQDYYNYLSLYNETVHWGNISPWSIFLLSDPLFRFLNWGAYCIGIGYPMFASLFSFTTMIILYSFFKNYCKGSILALLIYYSLCYIIYDFSVVRQGFVMAVELSIMLPLLKERSWLRYYFILLLMIFIHQSAIICALFPIIVCNRMSLRIQLLLVVVSTMIMFMGINIINYIPFPGFIEGRLNSYVEANNSGNFMAYIVRVLLIIPVFLVHRKVYHRNEMLRLIKDIIVVGYILYCFTAFSEIISSRINGYFRVLECYFIYLLIHETSLKIINRQLAIGYIAIYSVLFANNINGFIVQGGYKNCNVLTYPYLNVFDSNETILYYRTNLGYADKEALGF